MPIFTLLNFCIVIMCIKFTRGELAFRMLSLHKIIYGVTLKHWYKYIEKFLLINVQSRRWNTDHNNFVCLLIKLNRYSEHFKRYSNQMENLTQFRCYLIQASGRISFAFYRYYKGDNILQKHFLVQKTTFSKTDNYLWSINLDKNFMLNITSENIYCTNPSEDCTGENLTVYNSASKHETFAYCGHHSAFNLYPKFN